MKAFLRNIKEESKPHKSSPMNTETQKQRKESKVTVISNDFTMDKKQTIQ